MRPVRTVRLLLGAVLLALSLAAAPAGAQARPQDHGRQPQAAGPTGDRDGREVGYKHVCAPPTGPDRASCMALLRTDLPPLHTAKDESQIPGYHPEDIQSAYDLPRHGGAGRTVAIVNAFDNPNAESDLAVYRRTFHLPPCTTANGCFRKINQNGGTTPPPTTDPTWALETSLDLDAVSAACPDCKILLVEANNNLLVSSLLPAVDQAVAQGAKFVSMSWAAPEQPAETTLDTHFPPGIAFVAGSGDSGYPDQNYPATSRYVTAAGGTTLHRIPTHNGYRWSETAWLGSGSACSLYEPKPAFQHDPGCPRRTTVDISALASPFPGFAIYNTFSGSGWGVSGGTSLASPLIASMYAIAGTPGPTDRPNSYPYAHPGAFSDVLAGYNSFAGCSPAYLCVARPGYDGPTGLGTPRGVRGLRP
ncbi:S8 family serine peptidase [Streptomyces sp. NPDC097981]|uniref:S53 family peptidase n=1 Tax=Streptomyces sp. NPDC097981 TaxID=3155428 RepID=UPI0033261E7E